MLFMFFLKSLRKMRHKDSENLKEVMNLQKRFLKETMPLRNNLKMRMI